MGYTDPTLKKLFGLSGNMCAFPECNAAIIDSTFEILVGEICHIKSKSSNGPRYDSNQTDEERNSYENLLVMCNPHNKIVDHPDTRDKFPVELLRRFKDDHEAQFKNTVVSCGLSYKFVSHFISFESVTSYNQSGGQTANIINNFPTEQPQVSLASMIEPRLVKVDPTSEIDYYECYVKVHNQGQTTVRDFCVDIKIPTVHARESFSDEVTEQRTVKSRVWRRAQNDPLYPNDCRQVMRLGFLVTHKQYKEALDGEITVLIYLADRIVSKFECTMLSLVKPERARHFLSGGN
jgi:hypothetical protein